MSRQASAPPKGAQLPEHPPARRGTTTSTAGAPRPHHRKTNVNRRSWRTYAADTAPPEPCDWVIPDARPTLDPEAQVRRARKDVGHWSGGIDKVPHCWRVGADPAVLPVPAVARAVLVDVLGP